MNEVGLANSTLGFTKQQNRLRGVAMATENYERQIQNEIKRVPPEYLPTLFTIVHAFREGLELKSAEESFEQGWKEAMEGETHSIDTLWDDIEK